MSKRRLSREESLALFLLRHDRDWLWRECLAYSEIYGPEFPQTLTHGSKYEFAIWIMDREREIDERRRQDEQSHV